jgi:hypothetical protein
MVVACLWCLLAVAAVIFLGCLYADWRYARRERRLSMIERIREHGA